MARAFVKFFEQIEYAPVEAKDKAVFQVVFVGAEVPFNSETAYGEVFLDPGDPVSQIRGKITEIVLLEAAARGFVVAKQDMAIPTLQQGV